MILIDLTTTSHCEAHTGVQRVCRSLYRSLAESTDVLAVCFDPYLNCWRELDASELLKLEMPEEQQPGGKRSAYWPVKSKLRGYFKRGSDWAGKLYQKKYDGLVVPEVFTAAVGKKYAELFELIEGPRIAVSHDLFPIQLPQFSSPAMVHYFPKYLDGLKGFDGIAANSQATRDQLVRYWNDSDESPGSIVTSIPLGVEMSERTFTSAAPDEPRNKKRILCVGTFEGRKNQLNLLKAAVLLWDQKQDFELDFIGGLNRGTGQAAAIFLENLKQKGYRVSWNGNASEQELSRGYLHADFTVYPSIAEGFGLPVIESLSFGRPCVCGEGGGLKEIVHGGGCLPVDVHSVDAIASGIKELLENPKHLQRLTSEARARHFPSWKDYAASLLKWMESL